MRRLGIDQLSVRKVFMLQDQTALPGDRGVARRQRAALREDLLNGAERADRLVAGQRDAPGEAHPDDGEAQIPSEAAFGYQHRPPSLLCGARRTRRTAFSGCKTITPKRKQRQAYPAAGSPWSPRRSLRPLTGQSGSGAWAARPRSRATATRLTSTPRGATATMEARPER